MGRGRGEKRFGGKLRHEGGIEEGRGLISSHLAKIIRGFFMCDMMSQNQYKVRNSN